MLVDQLLSVIPRVLSIIKTVLAAVHFNVNVSLGVEVIAV
jgi:hypothetical protein